ncbi:acyltransferase [Dechloromonas sp. A34]|uniref:acyltransferase n=1 Tax=Dechloromonas sp. A34 TaxID=447588 RepID=UPI0022488198|nr:DapH/DapD/GlmU-related protein [Dechloromonas sp. A34]
MPRLKSLVLDLLLKVRQWRLENRLGALGKGSTVCFGVRISNPEQVFIGAGVSIAPGVWIGASSKGRVTIGDGSAIASGVRFVTPTHDPDVLPVSGIGINRPVTIGRDVWIGTGAIILPGVAIGDGTIVGAGAVVNRDLPPDVLAAGVPAIVVKTLLPRETRLENGRHALEMKRRSL